MDKTSEEVLVKHKKTCLFTTVLLLCGCAYLFSSCGTEDDVSGNGNQYHLPASGAPVTVSFTVGESDFVSNGMSVRSTAPYPHEGTLVEETVVLISPPKGESEGAVYMHALLKEEVEPVKLRAGQLNTGAKVRVVAYEDTGSGYIDKIGHADYVVAGGGVLIMDGTLPLTVPAGTTYRFVAYSYNNADPMLTFADMTAAIDPCDLLWGETLPVTVGPGHNTVYILLEHLFAQVKLHVELHHTVLNRIEGIQTANVSHTFPALEVSTGGLIAGSSSQIPFVWSGVDPASNWYSINHQIYTAGGYPAVTIGNVEIDGTIYSGPWAITYNTPLAPGHEYTLYIYFMEDEILCGVLESPEFDTWGNY